MSRLPPATSTTPLLSSPKPGQASRRPDYSLHLPSSPSKLRPPRPSRPPLAPIESYQSYASIPSRPVSTSRHRSNSRFRRRRERTRTPVAAFFPAFITVVLLSFASFAAWDVSSAGNCWLEPLCRILGDGERTEEVWWRNSGAYAPWKSLGVGGGKRGLPRGCAINQVTIVCCLKLFERETDVR